MTKCDNKEVKYSLLLAGEILDIEKIRDYLEDGIKVLWFGTARDKEILDRTFPKYIKEYFLCVYHSSGRVRLTIIDGRFTTKEHKALVLLEHEDSSFNLRQYEIEHDGDDPFVVVQAGAGSGKTFVMTNRILYLLHTKEDFHFSDIVMVTFTNEATDSMRRRLIESLNAKLLLTKNIKYLKWIEDASQLTISTIHAFFKNIIKEISPLLGYGTNLRLTSMTMEKKKILRDIMNKQYGDSDKRVMSFLGLAIHELEDLAMDFWKRIENNGMSGEEVALMDWGDWGDTDYIRARNIQEALCNIFTEVEAKYDAQKLKNNSITMGDILHELNRVQDESAAKDFISSKYKYLFCDEFQDTDDIQIRTIAFLDKVYDGNLFVVGDVKQSIYRFRGATDSAFEKLEENIKDRFGTTRAQTTYSLTKNYRTSGDILDELDKIFRMWGDKGYLRYEYSSKNNDVLIPQKSEAGVYKQIVLDNPWDREDMFFALIDRIEWMIGSQNKSIMVLTRSNWQLQQVKQWCENAGKACAIRESGAFFKGAAVTDFCALVEAMLYHSEPMYLFNLLRSAYCFKPIDTKRLESYSGSKKEMLTYLNRLINEELEWEKIIDELRKRPVMSVLCEIITSIRPSVKYGAIQKHIYEIDGYEYEEGIRQAILDAKQYEADLQKLLQMLTELFSDEFSSLSDICNYVRLRINTDRDEESADVRDLDEMHCIQGSTVHGAKGLEFDYVVIPFMDDTFGKNDRSEILVDKEKKQVGWQYVNKDGAEAHNLLYESLKQKEDWEVIGDETRLLYVAMTRAKEGLFCFTNEERNDGLAQNWADLLPEEYDDANYL